MHAFKCTASITFPQTTYQKNLNIAYSCDAFQVFIGNKSVLGRQFMLIPFNGTNLAANQINHLKEIKYNTNFPYQTPHFNITKTLHFTRNLVFQKSPAQRSNCPISGARSTLFTRSYIIRSIGSFRLLHHLHIPKYPPVGSPMLYRWLPGC